MQNFEAVPGRTGYVICSEPRSGSTYLAQVLGTTGNLGFPSEIFATGHDVNLAKSAPKKHVDCWIDRTSSSNGVYGVKVFTHQFDLVESSRWIYCLPNPCYIHFQREDLLGQALSSVRAQQTGQFESGQQLHHPPKFAPRLIRAALTRIAHNQARWAVWFARNGITPLRLSYEQLLGNPQRTAEMVARYVGVSGPVSVDLSKVQLRIQRDDISEKWRQQFIDAYGDEGYLDDDFGRVRPILRRLRRGRNP